MTDTINQIEIWEEIYELAAAHIVWGESRIDKKEFIKEALQQYDIVIVKKLNEE